MKISKYFIGMTVPDVGGGIYHLQLGHNVQTAVNMCRS